MYHARHTVTGTGTTTTASVLGVTLEVGMGVTGTTEAAFLAYYHNVVLVVE